MNQAPQALSTLQQTLQAAIRSGLERLDAQCLLLHALGRSSAERAWLLAHGDAALTPAQQQAFTALCARRLAHEPLAYITGHKAFYGLQLAVDARVLDPRADTETLVDWALELLVLPAVLSRPLSASSVRPAPAQEPRSEAQALQALDLGTGSGAIALALAQATQGRTPPVQLTATDASADALAVAQANAQRHQLPVYFVHGDWFAPLAGQRFNLIVSNPPYIRAVDPHLATLQHEPLSALASGADGLADLRRIVQAAPAHLLPGAWLLLEHGYDQATDVRALLQTAGFAQVQTRCDLAGVERCSGGALAA